MKTELSRWWRYGVLAVALSGLSVLLWITLNTYTGDVGTPIPERVLDPEGRVVFTGADIIAGQQVFQKHGLMENGSIWGHGAYLGPDFSAAYLHQLALDTPDPATLRENRYDGRTGTLRFTEPEVSSFRRQIGQWEAYFDGSLASRGLRAKSVSDPEELRVLVAFFAWTAWGSAARMPGKDYTYTQNFPYEPLLGNGPSGEAILWSALSLITLLAGTGVVLLAFGRFDLLGWRGRDTQVRPQLLPGRTTLVQRATLKFFVVVVLLFLAQVLAGAALAHYRTDPGSFFGFDLAAWLPSNLLRTWHLQSAIFWVVTAYVAGGLFLADALGSGTPRGQVRGINVLWAALMLVVVGSVIGEFVGIRQMAGELWFWFGNQGWEYLDLGRGWQVLLFLGLCFWVVLLARAVAPARRDPERREIATLFLISAATIPFFYLPAFFFGTETRFTVIDTWRFWIVHLWVEAFLELFVTVMVATMFYRLGLVTRQTAARVIYLDALLFLGSGIIGTGHHWFFTGQTTISMALSSVFSAMEVVPLILLTLEATHFVRLSRQECDECGKPVGLPHKWTFYFLISVGVWNFVGAGVFGFLINLPVVSYYEIGTNLTANHAHAAFMGVFGMLAVALLVFTLRQVSTEAHWEKMQGHLRVSFWGLNLGLAGMVALNLFPIGVLQLLDVTRHGYWHARSTEFSSQPLIVALEWARLPGDVVFIFFGVVPLVIVTLLTYRHARAGEGAGLARV
ncbi:MAG: cbb3-type cytochrome c oxidase subunit I [Candidatus Didemnitutus sp.]|nr:cbb3-type cytochrome c oxidase subunit I [Candidatus Didemnitutus sp.]